MYLTQISSNQLAIIKTGMQNYSCISSYYYLKFVSLKLCRLDFTGGCGGWKGVTHRAEKKQPKNPDSEREVLTDYSSESASWTEQEY